ncbi:MAG: hypothetical protein E7591_04550 [Ruminococcaceae bacterium]|nr:hypothetical protein [Oscillospiraceae bacterium]
MNYNIVVWTGLIAVLLIFIQLYNETRAQNRQIRKMFEHVFIRVYGIKDNEISPLAVPVRDESIVEYPLVSTNITCGRKTDQTRFKVDMPIDTEDITLKETAAEFCIEPYENSLKLYIRPLDQDVIWFGGLGKSSKEAVCIMKNPVKDENGEWILPPPPAVFNDKMPEYYSPTNHYPSLKIGDVVVIGQTKFVIGYDKDGV